MQPDISGHFGTLGRRIGEWPVQTRSVAHRVRQSNGVSCALHDLPLGLKLAVVQGRGNPQPKFAGAKVIRVPLARAYAQDAEMMAAAIADAVLF